MKKYLTVIISALLCVCLLCGCGKTTYATGDMKIKDVIKLGNYKNLSVDTSSEDFTAQFKELEKSDASTYAAFDKLESGKVENGDVANIDYVGKKDGVAFDGGTAQGYDLEIGSGSFIAGFEDGLIGVEVGSTVDLHLTFPENYDNTELAGKAVIFTVTVNYRQVPQTYEKFYSAAGFKSAEEYKKDLTDRTVKICILNMAANSAELIGSPSDDTFKAVFLINFYDKQFMQVYGLTTEGYLEQAKMSMDEFADSANSSVTVDMIMKNADSSAEFTRLLVTYAIYEDAELKIDSGKLKDLEGIKRAYNESKLVKAAVEDYLLKNSNVK